MENEKITAWVTRYALTAGILEVAGEICNGISQDILTYRLGMADCYAHGNDWHRTREEAMARAEKMRVAKIARLKKNIAKLESLTFETP